MNCNLKTRPKTAYTDGYSKDVDAWFEGFEKELRDILKQHDSGRYWSVDILIKEILAE